MSGLRKLSRMLCLVAALAGCGGEGLGDGLDAFNAGRHTEAARIFDALANRGDGMAQYYLGRLYETGQGVTRSDERAAALYQAAARQNIANAQGNLAVLYAYGRGVQRDLVQSYVLSTLAAAGYARWSRDLQQGALRNRDIVAARMTAIELYEAQRRLAAWELGGASAAAP